MFDDTRDHRRHAKQRNAARMDLEGRDWVGHHLVEGSVEKREVYVTETDIQ
jgi:hypothetical protein